MPRRATRDLTVGVVLALALVVLAVAIMTVGESHLFATKTVYRVVFPTTDGLRIGSPVRMAGVLVGSVSDIRLPTSPEASGIEVQLDVATDYTARIRQNSEAMLRYLQLLSGEKYVDLTPGDPALPELPAGAVIPTKAQQELLAQSADIAENVNEITGSLKQILGPLERGEGLLGEMIHDPEFGKRGIEAVTRAFEDLEAITSQIRSGHGFVGRAIYDEEFAATLTDLSRAMKDMAAAMEAVGRKEGAIGALLEEGGPGEQAVNELRDTAASLRRTVEKLESRDNLLGRMLNDREYSERVASDLEELLRNLREITGKINRGEGTVGALINDRAVYDGIEDIVVGVNDSDFARWLTRRYRKKGIVVQEEDQAPDEAP